MWSEGGEGWPPPPRTVLKRAAAEHGPGETQQRPPTAAAETTEHKAAAGKRRLASATSSAWLSSRIRAHAQESERGPGRAPNPRINRGAGILKQDKMRWAPRAPLDASWQMRTGARARPSASIRSQLPGLLEIGGFEPSASPSFAPAILVSALPATPPPLNACPLSPQDPPCVLTEAGLTLSWKREHLLFAPACLNMTVSVPYVGG